MTPTALDLVIREQTDEELVGRAREGDEAALAELLTRFRPHVRSKAKTYFLAGGDRQDVVQEGMIGLYKAVRDYDRSRHPSFRHFADLCVTRQIITAIKTATRRKHAPLNAYVSLQLQAGADDEADLEFAERIADVGSDPIHLIVSEADLARLKAYVLAELSDLEIDVLTRYVGGSSYAQIAQDLGRHTKAIDNAIQRIKRKLETYVETIQDALE